MGKSTERNTYPYELWLDAKMQEAGITNGALARECAAISRAEPFNGDERRSRGGAYVPKREIGLFRSGARLPGPEWAYRIGRALRNLEAETTGLRSLWTAANDNLRPGVFAHSRDAADALYLVAVMQIPALLDAAERGLSFAELTGFDDGYGAWLWDAQSETSASRRAVYRIIRASLGPAWRLRSDERAANF